MGMDEQFERNGKAFKILRPELLKNHRGKFALLFDEEVIGIFDLMAAAFEEGTRRFNDRGFYVGTIVAPGDPTPNPNAHLRYQFARR